jgi:hypothetical protein
MKEIPSLIQQGFDHDNLSLGIIPRYCGNRLHILFHTCKGQVSHYAKFKEMLTMQMFSAGGGLRDALLADFTDPFAIKELRAGAA